jgi:uncharacterized membrane protein YfcA
MQIYLPIAEMSVNIFLLIGLGGLVGILSGMFGVGGGFLMTPLLFFIGIPPAVAVATEANQIVASSFSGVLAHVKKRTVDFKMGTVLLLGGLLGAAVGVQVFKYLKEIGQVDLLITLSYVVFLGMIGSLMFIESLGAIRRSKKSAPPKKIKRHTCSGCDHGCRRRVHHGACDDLCAGDANESGYRDLAVPNYFCDRVYYNDARDAELYG